MSSSKALITPALAGQILLTSGCTSTEANNTYIPDFTINTTISKIISEPCFSQKNGKISDEGEKIQKFLLETLSVNTDDCIVNLLYQIPNIQDKLLTLYNNNPSQLETDINQYGIHLFMILHDTNLLNNIKDFHSNFHDINFSAEHINTYKLIESNKDELYNYVDTIFNMVPNIESKDIQNRTLKLINMIFKDNSIYNDLGDNLLFLNKYGYKIPDGYFDGKIENLKGLDRNIEEPVFILNQYKTSQFLLENNKFLNNNIRNLWGSIRVSLELIQDGIDVFGEEQYLYNLKDLITFAQQNGILHIPITTLLKINSNIGLNNFYEIKKHLKDKEIGYQQSTSRWYLSLMGEDTGIDNYTEHYNRYKNRVKNRVNNEENNNTNRPDCNSLIKEIKAEESEIDEINNIYHHKNLLTCSMNNNLPTFNDIDLMELAISEKNYSYALYLLDNINVPMHFLTIKNAFESDLQPEDELNFETKEKLLNGQAVNTKNENRGFTEQEIKEALDLLIGLVNNGILREDITQPGDNTLLRNHLINILQLNSQLGNEKLTSISRLLGNLTIENKSIYNVIDLLDSDNSGKYVDDIDFLSYLDSLSEPIKFSNLSFIYEIYKNNIDINSFSKDVLIDSIKKHINNSRQLHRSDLDGGWYHENDLESIDNMGLIDVLQLNYLIQGILSQDTFNNIVTLMNSDFDDRKTEHGGQIKVGIDTKIEIVPINALEQVADTVYIGGEFYQNSLSTASYGYHFHAVYGYDLVSGTGPSSGDRMNAKYNNTPGIVITKIDKKSFNIDIFFPDGAVLDLGYFNEKKVGTNSKQKTED